MRRKHNKNPSANLKNKLANAELSLQKDMADAKTTFESSLVYNFAATNNNKIFKYISSITKSSSMPATMHYNDTSESSDSGTAQLFNHYFFSVYSKSRPLDFSIEALSSTGGDHLDDVSFIPQDILSILSSLDTNKAMGIDCLSPKVLRHCASAIFFPFIIYSTNVFYKVLSLLDGKSIA